MKIKDTVVSWYIKNILLSKLEIMDYPGYVLEQFGELKLELTLRELLLSESLFSNLEKKIKNNYKKVGEQKMYTIGKKFGYINSSISTFPMIETIDKKKFLNFVYFLIKYVEGTYASKIVHKIDYKNKIFQLTMDNYVICRKNGLGYILTSGGTAGIWAYMTCDPTVEGVQTKCQGRGDEKCELICAPAKVLKEKHIKFFRETDLEKLEIDSKYMEINKIRPTQFARYSLKDLIDSGFFKYSKGSVHYKDERHFLCEASLMYILEKELKKLKGAGKILFDVSFDYGKSLAEKRKQETNNTDYFSGTAEGFITNYMSALGWGDVLVMKKSGKYTVISNYFPWTKWAKNIKFIMFRGIISGLLSGFLNKKITLKKFQTDFSEGFLTVTADE